MRMGRKPYLFILNRRYKSVYEIFNVEKSIKSTELTKLITSRDENLPLSLEDQQEIKSYLNDPIRYQLANELKEKRLNTVENEISFFGSNTNKALSKFPDSTQENIKNSMAHLSFRSGTYIAIILFYLLMRSTMITQDERNKLLEKHKINELDKKTIGDFYEAFSLKNIFENLSKLISNDVDSTEK